MAKVKLNIARQPVATLLQSANNIKTALTGNASFPALNPPLVDLDAAITDLTNWTTTHQASVNTAREHLTMRDAAAEKLTGIVNSLGAHVQNVSGGDAALIQSAGMGVKGRRTPPAIPAQVENLSISAGDDGGQLDLQWDPLPEAWTYDVQLCADPVTPASNWVIQPSPIKSKLTVKNLTSGVRMWARVRAVNPAGQGAWSDPATKIVP